MSLDIAKKGSTAAAELRGNGILRGWPRRKTRPLFVPGEQRESFLKQRDGCASLRFSSTSAGGRRWSDGAVGARRQRQTSQL